MATARAHVRIASAPERVWSAISNPTGIEQWFPGVATCTSTGDVRHVTTADGVELDERIVTNDSALMRFQYSIVPGVVPVESHLATVDVIADGDGSLVMYAADVEPAPFGPAMQQSCEAALAGLAAHIGTTQE